MMLYGKPAAFGPGLTTQVASPVVVDTACALQVPIWLLPLENATVPPLGVGETVAV